jgi:hypothetical protein
MRTGLKAHFLDLLDNLLNVVIILGFLRHGIVDLNYLTWEFISLYV